MNFFDQLGEERAGPLTGDKFRDWSDRLRDVEELLDDPKLRSEVARVRDKARAIRAEFKRHGKSPEWDLVENEIIKPLDELQEQMREELLKKEGEDSLVPIDRDPVPGPFVDLVRRYYEQLGRGE